MRSLTWRRVARDRWVVVGTDLALTYCGINCHFIAYRAGKPLFQILTLEEAEQFLSDLALCGEVAP